MGPCGKLALTVSLLAIGAHASADADLWPRVQDEAQARTGAAPSRASAESRELVSDLLADGVTRDEAVRIALVNNAALQAAFNRLGIARADVIEAGLYSNPELGALLRFPRHERGRNVELELAFNIADLWLVPVRRGLARARAEQATVSVVSEVLNTAADARLAHDACVFGEAGREKAARVLEASQAWRDHVHYREGFGFTSELDKTMADAFVAERRIELAEAETEVAVAWARLHRTLGLEPSERDALVAVGAVPDTPAAPPELAPLLEDALAGRPDLLAARLGVTAAQRDLTLQRRSLWGHVGLGPAFEHDPDGTNLWGGMLQVELPLFDRNQGGRARAAAEFERSGNAAAALAALVREQVTIAHERLRLALAREAILRSEIIPARERALEYATRYYNEMQLNMLYMLEAREALYHAQKEHLLALQTARAAEVELQFAVGRLHPAN